jgi:hypothetical protein
MTFFLENYMKTSEFSKAFANLVGGTRSSIIHNSLMNKNESKKGESISSAAVHTRSMLRGAKSRMDPACMDCVFQAVEGKIQVARNEPPVKPETKSDDEEE